MNNLVNAYYWFLILCVCKEKLQASSEIEFRNLHRSHLNINFVAKSVASLSHFFVAQPTGKLEILLTHIKIAKQTRGEREADRGFVRCWVLGPQQILSSPLIPITLWDHIRRSNSNLGNLNFIVFVWSSVSIWISVYLSSSLEIQTRRTVQSYINSYFKENKIYQKKVLQDIWC